MEFSWATSIPKTSAPFLVPLKRFSNVRVTEIDDRIWLQGEPVSQNERQDVDVCLQQISGAIRFDRFADDQLVPSGNTLPSSRLPQLPEDAWVSLTDWITFRLPQASLAGATSDFAKIKIVRQSSPHANQTQQPSILLCGIEEFVTWANRASDHRIKRLSFACNSEGTVIVRGTPLPSLRGRTFIDHDKIAIETGHSWSPAVSINTLKQILHGDDSQLLLCLSGKEFRAIDLHDFVAATRAGIRVTAKKFGTAQGVSK